MKKEHIAVEYDNTIIEVTYLMTRGKGPDLQLKVGDGDWAEIFKNDWTTRTKEYFFSKLKKYDCSRITVGELEALLKAAHEENKIEKRMC